MFFRPKSERFIFTKAGDQYNAKNVNAYLGKAVPVCPYSGDSVNVVDYPVDFNRENKLPSNMSYVSKTLLANPDGDIIMAHLEISSYFGVDFTIAFYAPTFVLDKEIKDVESLIDLKFKEEDAEVCKKNPTEGVYAMWDALMLNNVKGIFGVELSIRKSGGATSDVHKVGGATTNAVKYCAEAQFAFGKIYARMEERKKMTPASTIHMG